MTDETVASPLAEVDPTSLDELFDRVNSKLISGLPELITEDDLFPVCKVLREARVKFLQEQDKLGKAPPAPRKTKPRSVKEVMAEQAMDTTTVDLDDVFGIK